jgi:hypothetical protein
LPWGTDKFVVRMDDSLTVPKMKVLQVSGPVYPWAEITISSKDLAEAVCLRNIKQTTRS